VAVWSFDYTAAAAEVPGTLAPSGTWTLAPGDSAVWERWKTSRMNSRGKPIYLRKYYHDATIQTTASPDTVTTSQKTALEAFGTKLVDGSFAGARTIRSRSHAETIISHACSQFVTTRTLHRRGRRPPS
jgi:hypothetical protein